MCGILGSGENFGIFELPIDLISCNFSMILAHFQTKKGHLLGAGWRDKTLQWGRGATGAGGGGLWPLQYIC